MKKVLHLLLLLVANITFAQVESVPQYINYKGTAYNTNGTLISNTLIKVRVSIINGPSTVYQETRSNVPTNSLGEYSLKIGAGTQISSGSFEAIDWTTNYTKQLKIEIDPTNTGASYPIMEQNDLLSVPYAFYAKESLSYRVVNNLEELRKIPNPDINQIVYVKGHTTPGDGGGGNFMWSDHYYFTHPNITTYVWDTPDTSGADPTPPVQIDSPFYYANTTYGEAYDSDTTPYDNDGTILEARNQNGNPIKLTQGRWVRQYNGYIDVRYFGVFGNSGNQNEDTKRVERAINFAYQNMNIEGAPTKGTTVFFPNGSYILNKIPIRHGVALLGDSMDRTVIVAAKPGDPDYTAPAGWASDYLFQLDKGIVQTRIENFNIIGRGTEDKDKPEKGGFYLVSQPGPPSKNSGGLWNSSFENIKITGFNKNGMYLKGGGDSGDNKGYNLPFQFNTYKNVTINRLSDDYHCLKIEGSVNQQTFINCLFDGYKTGEDAKRPSNENIQIRNSGGLLPGIYSFINCSIQDSDIGVTINSGIGITFDTCWFESLGTAIVVGSSATYDKSKGINIINNSFADAAGFGTKGEVPSSNIKSGSVIKIYDAEVNVINNYVKVGVPGNPATDDDLFIIADKSLGVNVQGNSFQHPSLSRTIGIMSVIQNVNSGVIDCQNHKEVFVNSTSNTTPSSVVIHKINSDILATESILIRANNGNITFNTMYIDTNGSAVGNIYLAGKYTLTIGSGEIAIFTKIDNQVGGLSAT